MNILIVLLNYIIGIWNFVLGFLGLGIPYL